MGCTDPEIAAWFQCSTRTIETVKKEEPYKTIYEQAKLRTNVSLRRVQLKAALEGNTTMMIWLGKTMLKQSDRVQIVDDPLSRLLAAMGAVHADQPKA